MPGDLSIGVTLAIANAVGSREDVFVLENDGKIDVLSEILKVTLEECEVPFRRDLDLGGEEKLHIAVRIFLAVAVHVQDIHLMVREILAETANDTRLVFSKRSQNKTFCFVFRREGIRSRSAYRDVDPA